MAIRLPPNPKVEIEFSAGTWTDVTADVDHAVTPVQIRFGRSSEFSQPQVGELSLALRNFDGTTGVYHGRYAPQNQASPYWPNIQPRKRIRYSYNPGTQRWRFFGEINAWEPQMLDGYRSIVQVSATDVSNRLSRVQLRSPIRQATKQDGAVLSWPLTEPQDSTLAAEQSGTGEVPLRIVDFGTAPTFGDAGPGVGDGTGVRFTPGGQFSGQYLSNVLTTPVDLSAAGYTIECYLNTAALPAWGTGTGDQAILGFDDGWSSFGFRFQLHGGQAQAVQGIFLSGGPASLADGAWHHLAVTCSAAGVGILYVDGTNVDSGSSFGLSNIITRVYVGEDINIAGAPVGRYQGNVGEVNVYPSVLSATRITEHAAARTGYAGDTTDERIARWLGAAGLTASDWDLDTGIAVVNTYPQDGKDVLAACQDMVTTEGGGAALYVTPDGTARSTNRHYRYTDTTLKLTLDAQADLDVSTYSPSYDGTILVDQVTVDRSSESGSQSTQTHTDVGLVALFGILAQSITTYTTDDTDALNLAQYLVAHSRPALRFPQIGVDLAASSNDRYDAVGQVRIGDRIRLTNIPPEAYSHTTLDLFVEGWTETHGVDSYKWVADVSAADNPAVMILDDTVYGRLQCDGQTLTADITNVATSLSISTAASKPTFTTTAARYPMQIQIGEEIITLNSAPGGATSPQSFTGVTRGDKGTQKVAQTAGSTVNLWPAVTLAL